MFSKRGFTLLELLAVMALMIILTGVYISSMGVGASRQFTMASMGVQNLLAQAQAEAMARNTYVWVGFTNTTSSGLPQLAAAAVYSPDGTASATPVALTKVTRWPNVQLTDSGSVGTGVKALLPVDANVVSLSKSTAGKKTFPAMGQPTFTPSYTLTFTPQGEVLLTPTPGTLDGYQTGIDIALRRTAGSGVVSSNPDDIVLRVYGGSGKVREFRLK